MVDDVERGRRLAQRLVALGGGAHRDLRQLLDRQVGKVFLVALRLALKFRVSRERRRSNANTKTRESRRNQPTHAQPHSKFHAAAIRY